MRPKSLITLALLFQLVPEVNARVVKLRVERREAVLNGKSFGAVGPYEKLVGKVEFALDPAAPANAAIVDLSLAPRNARGEVEFSADFYLLKPVDASRGNGRLLYEVGNRGGKGLLHTFQKAKGSPDPTTAAEFGDGLLMTQGYALLWMGWQWDVPEGMMRMDMPIATDHGQPITGLVRANFIPNAKSDTGPLADRGHRAYPVDNPASRYPDFVTIAKGFGAGGRYVKEKSELDDALKEMINSKGPYVLDVEVPYQEHVLPMIPAGMTVKDLIKE